MMLHVGESLLSVEGRGRTIQLGVSGSVLPLKLRSGFVFVFDLKGCAKHDFLIPQFHN